MGVTDDRPSLLVSLACLCTAALPAWAAPGLFQSPSGGGLGLLAQWAHRQGDVDCVLRTVCVCLESCM